MQCDPVEFRLGPDAISARLPFPGVDRADNDQSMSTRVPSQAVIEPRGGTRKRLVHRARALSLLSIAWMGLEAGVAIVAAVLAGSVALLAFGLDSLIELGSAGTILWLYTGQRNGSAAAERRAQQVVAICFGALALYVTVDAILTLASAARPDASWPGGCGGRRGDRLHAAARPRQGSRRLAAWLGGDGRRRRAVLAVRARRRRDPQHPRQRGAWLMVA
jgi:hypothetical protein